MSILFHLTTFLSTASSIVLACVTLNGWLFKVFAASPKAFPILGLSLIGVGIEGVNLFSELGHASPLAVVWHGLMFALDVGFALTVYRRLVLYRMEA